MIYLKQFVITGMIFFSIDIFWLAFVANRLYRHYLGHLMAENVMLVAAVVFYVVYIIGLLYFVIHPALDKNSLKYAFLTGLFFGFITYSTYDLTNLATLKDWPVQIVLIDISWGTLLGGLVSSVSYLILSRF